MAQWGYHDTNNRNLRLFSHMLVRTRSHCIILQLVRFVFTKVFSTVPQTPHYTPCDNCQCCHWSLTALMSVTYESQVCP